MALHQIKNASEGWYPISEYFWKRSEFFSKCTRRTLQERLNKNSSIFALMNPSKAFIEISDLVAEENDRHLAVNVSQKSMLNKISILQERTARHLKGRDRERSARWLAKGIASPSFDALLHLFPD